MDYLTYVIVCAIKISIAILVLALIYYYFICEVIKNNKKPELVKWNNKHVKKEIEKQMKKLEKRKQKCILNQMMMILTNQKKI